ncbi:hypothetical protein LSTR_LSTR000867 [Laodelphax striatellus]|uniref:Uncharacterized protein n=1 Tax=Laodelphax striatellus TaxID=195883 RepID=A0A482X1A8_LAOST|nr:hypothetical protein LSTR_LSTR000867 [Laodelphax striatellus]
MFPHKRFESRQLTSSQNLNNSQLRNPTTMNNQNMAQLTNKENEIYPRSGLYPDWPTPMQTMNVSTRQVPHNSSFPQNSASQGGARHSVFLSPNSGSFLQGGPRYNSQMSMTSNVMAISAPGYSRMLSHPTPVADTQEIWREESQYTPRNILTENTHLMNITNFAQRQPPNKMSFEASSSHKMTVGSSSMSYKLSVADPMTKTLAKFTPLVSSDKKKSVDQDVYVQFNMIGSVEQVICWNQMAKGKKCLITFELHGFLESITEESPSVSVLWIKQDPQNGPVIQGVFCNIDRRLTEKLQPGNNIVCYGRMLKTKIMQIFNAVVDNTVDVGIKRISFLCQRSLQEFINSQNSGN